MNPEPGQELVALILAECFVILRDDEEISRNQFDEWMQTYLKMFYENPNELAVAIVAAECATVHLDYRDISEILDSVPDD